MLTPNKQLFPITVTELNHDGKGVGRINDKVTFIDNALPGEEVLFYYTKKRSKFDCGIAVEILTAAKTRIDPICKHFTTCGGCCLQHLEPSEQLIFKAKKITDLLKHVGELTIENFDSILIGPTTGYRYKARLAVKYLAKKDRLLIGFHEKSSSLIADLTSCPMLHPAIGTILNESRELISSFSNFNFIPQLEIACSDRAQAIVIRHLKPFNQNDLELINHFAAQHQLQFYSQPSGINSINLITPNHSTPLSYLVDKDQLEIFFAPTDFTQINHQINKQLIERALKYLELNENDSVIDLYCGIGNFTLPIATKCKTVIGLEASIPAVIQAKSNAYHNGLNNIQFLVADLSSTPLSNDLPKMNKHHKILLDPPRSGAKEICSYLSELDCKKIIYVSCNPATFARDAKIITSKQRYRLSKISLADMYPHTSHLELIACFDCY